MLFKNTDTVGQEGGLKEYLGGIQKTMTWATWKPFVEGAEQSYIIPAIGLELYEELVAVSATSDLQKELRDKLKRALAWFAYVDAMPSLITVTGDGGMVVSSVPNTVAMSKWLYVEKKKQHIDMADRYMESALAWLEFKADRFPTWKASESYTIQASQLISSASEATKFFPPIQKSRRLYLSIRDYYNNAETEYLQPVLGEEFLVDLKSRLAGSGVQLTEPEKHVLDLARKALVHFGLYMAVPYLNMNTDFRLLSETDGIVNENVLDNARLNVIRNDAIAKGEENRGRLKNYLNQMATAEIFPLYFHSGLYVAPSGSYVRRPKNDPAQPYFVL